jgi:hypothetical protein
LRCSKKKSPSGSLLLETLTGAVLLGIVSLIFVKSFSQTATTNARISNVTKDSINWELSKVIISQFVSHNILGTIYLDGPSLASLGIGAPYGVTPVPATGVGAVIVAPTMVFSSPGTVTADSTNSFDILLLLQQDPSVPNLTLSADTTVGSTNQVTFTTVESPITGYQTNDVIAVNSSAGIVLFSLTSPGSGNQLPAVSNYAALPVTNFSMNTPIFKVRTLVMAVEPNPSTLQIGYLSPADGSFNLIKSLPISTTQLFRVEYLTDPLNNQTWTPTGFSYFLANSTPNFIRWVWSRPSYLNSSLTGEIDFPL